MRTNTFFNEENAVIDYKRLLVSSTAFDDYGFIPVKYTSDGAGVNPPLYLAHIPSEAKCLCVVMEDYDSLTDQQIHWLVWNIPLTHHLKERDVHGVYGTNDFQINEYTGPLSHPRIHKYIFKIYGLKQLLDLPPKSTFMELQKSMSPHIVAFGEVNGLY